MEITDKNLLLVLSKTQNNFQGYIFKDMDLSYIKLNCLDFSHSIFENIKYWNN